VCHQEDLKGDEQDATAVKADHAKSDETAEGSTEAVAIPKAKTRDGEKEEGGGSDDDIVMLDGPAGSPIRGKAAGDGKGRVKEDIRSTLRFRCYRCKQGAHYEHREFTLHHRASWRADQRQCPNLCAIATHTSGRSLTERDTTNHSPV
jgi:hypothetical protein